MIPPRTRLVPAMLLVALTVNAQAQEAPPPEIRHLLEELRPAPHPDPDAIRRGGTDWAALIDSVWGESPWNRIQRANIFNDFWNGISVCHGCWQGVPDNWDALYTQYFGEATAPSISAGRFHGIISQMVLAVQEGHTFVRDNNVSATAPAPGVPIFQRGVWGSVDHFGAAVTPLADGTGLVYDVVGSHPLGLEPGDRILGYDGRAWSELADELIDVHQLPINGHYWTSYARGIDHVKLGSVGMNWHLFSTIDVRKHATGEVQRLGTAPLSGVSGALFASEQLDIVGIPRPNFSTGDYVTHGILPGTNIGYINAVAWLAGADTEFETAIDELTQQMSTDGLVIDFRFNLGGDTFLSNPGLAILFTSDVATIDLAGRCGDPADRNSMCPLNQSASYIIPGDPATSYGQPIAVLNGPGTISAGDQVSLRMEFLANVKSFGTSTSATFNGPNEIAFNDPVVAAVYEGQLCAAEGFLLSAPGDYLTHDERSVDCRVWLTEDDVAQGVDTVLQSAIDWIEGTIPDLDGDGVSGSCDNCVGIANPAQIDSDLDGAGDDCDCAPGDATTYPGAVERNDGIDNQCPGDAGFGIVDESADASGFVNASDPTEYSWIGQLGAVEYEVARSTVADFSSDCTLFTTTETALVDASVPSPGALFHYLNRPSMPNTGSWGWSSAGSERSFVCNLVLLGVVHPLFGRLDVKTL